MTKLTTQTIKQQSQEPLALKPLTPEQIQRIIDLLDSWCNLYEEETQEQKENLEDLMQPMA